MVSGYDKHPEEPGPWTARSWIIAIAFFGFIAFVIWRLATLT